MKTIETAGRRMLFWGALMMIGWAMYELSIRFDEMVIWLSPVFALVRDGQLTLWDYFSRVNWARLTTHLFLVLCVLLGVYALLARKRPILVLLSVPSAILLGVFFMGSTDVMSASQWLKLKLIPLALIAVGGLFCFISVSKNFGSHSGKRGPRTPPSPRMYDPFRMKGPPE